MYTEYSSENFEEYPNRIPDNPLKNLTYANLPLETVILQTEIFYLY